ncbi:MAG: CHAD domain-containing protein [Thiogranum sp.]
MQKPLIYPLLRGDGLDHLRDRLKAGLNLESDAAQRLEITYYDSFDWRLYTAGKSLQCLRGADGTETRLVDLSNQAVAAALPWEVADRCFASSLPESEMRNRLEPLLGMRALLPLVALKVLRYCLRQEDAEGKTRVRLYLESFSLVDSAGRRRLLQKRLRLQPLRGYRKAADGLRHKLEHGYELKATDDQLFAQALTAAGKQAGDYTSGLSIDLQPGMRADAAVRRVLSELFATMKANEAGVIADLDSEFLHDFRVAVRRTRSALGELKRVFPPATLQRFRREFAWLGSLTGNVRDLDVYLLKFDTYKSAIPAGLREDLEPLRAFLRYKQHAEHTQQLAPQLRGSRYRKLKQQWQRFLDAPLAKRPTARDAAKPVGLVAHHRTWRVYKRVLKEGAAITPDSPHPELHELRKSCKKLRYLMEFFQSLYPPRGIRAAIKELKQLQDNLGDFQDADVQMGALKSFAMEMRRRGEYTAATGKAMDALLAVLESRLQRVRAEFESRFELFASDTNRARFKHLFHPREEADVA